MEESEVEKAAEEYAFNLSLPSFYEPKKEAFKAGAEWQKDRVINEPLQKDVIYEMVYNELCKEYSKQSVYEMMNRAKLKFNKHSVVVTYGNGVSNEWNVKYVPFLELKD